MDWRKIFDEALLETMMAQIYDAILCHMVDTEKLDHLSLMDIYEINAVSSLDI